MSKSNNDKVYGGFGNDSIVENKSDKNSVFEAYGRDGDDFFLLSGGKLGSYFVDGGNGSNLYVMPKNIFVGDINLNFNKGSKDTINFYNFNSTEFQFLRSGSHFNIVSKAVGNGVYIKDFLMVDFDKNKNTIIFKDKTLSSLDAYKLTLIGTAENDTILGLDFNDVMQGLAGDDDIKGEGGNDTIDGGSGNDSIYGQGGDDVLFGGSGDDYIDGGLGKDTISAGKGNNDIVSLNLAEGGSDVIKFYKGDQGLKIKFNNNKSSDYIASTLLFHDFYKADISSISSKNIYDLVITVKSGDVITIENFFKNQNALNIKFNNGTELTLAEIIKKTSVGTKNDDVIYGGIHINDNIYGLGGHDKIYGLSGNDVISGGQGNDYLYGGEDDDVLLGNEGNDELYGGKGKNILVGGNGNDTFYLNGGENTVIPGKGYKDTVFFNRYDMVGGNKIYFNKGDRGLILDYNEQGFVHKNVYNNDKLYLGAGIDKSSLKFYVGNDVFGNNYNHRNLFISHGNDFVKIKNYFFNLKSLDIYLSDGSIITSGEILNYFNKITEGDDTVYGTLGSDTLFATGGSDNVYGLDGDDTISAGEGGYGHSLYGGSGKDTLKVERTGKLYSARLYGGSDNDTLIGGATYNSLYGGAGDDILKTNGGYRSDLYGGDGNDTFIVDGDARIYMEAGDKNKVVLEFQKNPSWFVHDVDIITFLYPNKMRGDCDMFFGNQITAEHIKSIYRDGFGETIIKGFDIKAKSNFIISAGKMSPSSTSSKVDNFNFSDGFFITNRTLYNLYGDKQLSVRSSDLNNNLLINYEKFERYTINGGAGNDIIRAGLESNSVRTSGLGGSDKYIFGELDFSSSVATSKAKFSKVIIVNNSSNLAEDSAKFYLDYNKLWFSKSGNDLSITYLNSKKSNVTIENWYSGNKLGAIETYERKLDLNKVDLLVNAMSSFDVANGAIDTIPKDVKDKVDIAIADAWAAA